MSKKEQPEEALPRRSGFRSLPLWMRGGLIFTLIAGIYATLFTMNKASADEAVDPSLQEQVTEVTDPVPTDTPAEPEVVLESEVTEEAPVEAVHEPQEPPEPPAEETAEKERSFLTSAFLKLGGDPKDLLGVENEKLAERERGLDEREQALSELQGELVTLTAEAREARDQQMKVTVDLEAERQRTQDLRSSILSCVNQVAGG